jgi:hypothetical protein
MLTSKEHSFISSQHGLGLEIQQIFFCFTINLFCYSSRAEAMAGFFLASWRISPCQGVEICKGLTRAKLVYIQPCCMTVTLSHELSDIFGRPPDLCKREAALDALKIFPRNLVTHDMSSLTIV